MSRNGMSPYGFSSSNAIPAHMDDSQKIVIADANQRRRQQGRGEHCPTLSP
jgi:hypothetical protein